MHIPPSKQNLKYVCPRSHAPLTIDGETLRTVSGDIVYRVKSGIPQMLQFKPVEDQQTEAQLAQLNRLAREIGWQPALNDVYGEDSGMVRYVTKTERSSYIDLLPLTRESDVLEIGAGLGQFTTLLARRAGSVCALEVVPGQAEFAAERCRQEGINNVFLAVGGDDCRLPYSDGAFDVVVLNLVLEWCAMRCTDEPIIDVQRRLIREICRVLKPGGSFYLATKNRFSLRYLIGKPDEHYCDIRFGSALPRWLSGLLVRLKGHPRPFGMLHSYPALTAMLRDAGCDKIDSFWATPEMRYPTQYVPTDAASIRQARRKPGFIQGESRSTRLLIQFIPASLVKYITPGLAFLATKRL
jgi:SAM-dependent methyltransferase